jgi:hypothetical protein
MTTPMVPVTIGGNRRPDHGRAATGRGRAVAGILGGCLAMKAAA